MLGYPVSPDTLLRLIRGAPEAVYPMPAVLGVDDGAVDKGLNYGTPRHDMLDTCVHSGVAERGA